MVNRPNNPKPCDCNRRHSDTTLAPDIWFVSTVGMLNVEEPVHQFDRSTIKDLGDLKVIFQARKQPHPEPMGIF